jgi:hypothetical protein
MLFSRLILVGDNKYNKQCFMKRNNFVTDNFPKRISNLIETRIG